MKLIDRGLLLSLTLALIVVSGVSAYLYVQRQKLQMTSSPENFALNSQKSFQPTTAINGIETWKTYINNVYLYSVKIPSGWEPERGNPAGNYTDEELQGLDRMYWRKNNLMFSIEVLEPCASLDICFKEFQARADANAYRDGARFTTRGFETAKGIFQGVPSIEARSTWGENLNAIKGIFFVYKGKFWLIETQSLPSFKEVDQMLSTFKFL